MPTITSNWAGVVLILDHEETQQALQVPERLKELIPAAIERGLAVGIISATVFNPVSVGAVVIAITTYFTVQRELIATADQGCGVFLTLPWPAMMIAAQGGVIALAVIVPTTRPCTRNDWMLGLREGEMHSVHGDIIAFSTEANAVPGTDKEFRLHSDGEKWRKEMVLGDGLGNSWSIYTDGPRQEDWNGLWADQRGSLEFFKAGPLGIRTPVFDGPFGMEQVGAGDRVTFRWVQD